MSLSSRSATGQQGSATTFQWVGPSSAEGYYGPPAPVSGPAPVVSPAVKPAPAPQLSSRKVVAPADPVKSGEGETLFSSSAPMEVKAPEPTPDQVKKSTLQKREAVAHTKQYLEGLNPFQNGLTGFVTDYTPVGPALLRRAKNLEAKTQLIKDHPEMASAIQGDGILGSLWKNSTQGITELGLDLTELANVIIPVNDYQKVKEVTNAARVRMGMQPEPEISSRSQAIASAFDDTYQGVAGFLKDFRDSGVKVWQAAQIKDPVERRDAMGQWTQDLIDGIMGAGTLGVGTKLQNDQGFSSDMSAVYYKGQKIRDLSPGEKKIAGAGKTAGSVVGSMMVWKTLSPFAGRQVLAAMPQLTKFAVAHPFIFQVTAANLAEQGIQFAVAKTFNVPYTFADTVTSVIMQFGFETMNLGRAALSKGGTAAYDPIGLRAEQAAKLSELPSWAKGIDYEQARTQLDKVAEVFIDENGRAPTQMELQNLMGDVPVPVQKGAEPMTWNDLHERTAREWMARANDSSENRLIYKKAGQEGRPGIDYPAEPPDTSSTLPLSRRPSLEPASHIVPEDFSKLRPNDVVRIQKDLSSVVQGDGAQASKVPYKFMEKGAKPSDAAQIKRLEDLGYVETIMKPVEGDAVAKPEVVYTQKALDAAKAKTIFDPGVHPAEKASYTEKQLYNQNFITGKNAAGEEFTSNGYILEYGNVKDQPYYGAMRRKVLSDGQVDQITPKENVKQLEVAGYVEQGKTNGYLLRSNDGNTLAVVDNGYLNYFKKKYGEDVKLYGEVSEGPSRTAMYDELKKITGLDLADSTSLGSYKYLNPITLEAQVKRANTGKFSEDASLSENIKTIYGNRAEQLAETLVSGESPTKALIVKKGDQSVGLIMPIRMTDEGLRQIAEAPIVKTAGQPKVEPAQPKAPESSGNRSKIREKAKAKGSEPSEPPKASEAKKEAPRLSSRRKPVKQPLTPEKTQPARTSALRDRLQEKSPAVIQEPSSANIVKFMEDQFTAPIRVGKNSRGSLGTFYPKKNLVRLKNALDVPTAAHEIGHYIDNEYGLNKSFKDGSRYIEPYRSELLKMGEFTSKKSYSTLQKVKEGIAEFVRRYVEDPESLAEMAPNFKQHFEKVMPPEAIRLLEQVREAHAKLMAESPEYRVKSQISTEPPRDGIGKRVQKAVDTVFSAVDDDLLGLRKFVKEAETSMNRETLYKEDPYVLARLTRGLDGKTLQWLAPNLKPFDGQGRMLSDTRSLGTILQDVGTRRADFEAYLVSKRAMDLNAKDIGTGILSTDAEAVIKTMEARHPDFPKLQKEIVGWNRALLKYAQDKNFLSAEQVKNMTENGDNYVPFFRVIDEITTRGRGKAFADVSSPFKKMKGSTRQIISPLESMTKNAYAIISAVDRNRVGQAVVKLAQQHPDLGRWVEEIPAGVKPIEVNVEQVMKQLGLEDAAGSADEAITLFVRGSKPNVAGENIMMVVQDGKQKFYSVDPLLYNSVMSMNAENANVLIKALAAPASLLRAGATLTPEFMGRNPIRDQTTAFLYSRGGYIPGLDFARGVLSTISRSDDYQKAAIGGAMQANFVATDRPALKRYVDGMFATRGEKATGFFLHPLDGLRVLSEFGELGTRVGEARKVFAKEYAKSGDYEEALIKSAFSARNVTLDFGRRGWAGKTMNQIAAFWNANVQDVTKFGRELSGREKGSSPGMTAMKAIASITVPSIAFYEMSKNDERYKELPRWQKDYFWVAAIPGVPLIRIPKPFLPGLIFGSLPVRLLEAQDKGSLKPIQDFFVSLRENTLPGMMPTAMEPIIEYTTNYSMFFGRQIVPQSQQSLLPPDQYGIYTAETYKEIGKALNLSPLKIESLVYGYTAGLGRYGTAAIDFLGGKTGLMEPRPPAPEDVTQLPVIRAFTISDLTNVGQTVSDFYDTYTKAESTYASLENAAANKDAKRAKELRDNNLQDLIYIAPDGTPQLLHEAFGAVAETLSKLRQEREQTISSQTMGSIEKAQKILRINAAMRLVTGRALEMTKNRPKSVEALRALLSE